MLRVILTSLLLIWINTTAHLQSLETPTLSEQVLQRLRTRIEVSGPSPRISIGDEIIHASVMLPIFYERRTYRPAWSDDNGPLPQVNLFLKAIHDSYKEGLHPEDYHLQKIEEILREIEQNRKEKIDLNAGILTDLDLLLTDAFLIYSSHLVAGRVNPETIDPEWNAQRREADLATVLQNAVETQEIEDQLNVLRPRHDGYYRLIQALDKYRDIASRGGWSQIPDGSKMAKGSQGERVNLLRRRLFAEGYLYDEKEGQIDIFDDDLDDEVRKFQRNYGLDIDGIVGKATLEAMNVSVEERIKQIEVNLERWRWLPEDLGQRYAIINIANFELDVIEGGRVIMTMRAIVGRPYRRTPVFSDKITYIVLNPYWYVPKNIAVQDILPLIKKGTGYLAKNNIRIFTGWGANLKEINPNSIDWAKVNEGNFNFVLRQEPGPTNALGRIKFMFPNKYNVYIHDTPAKELFLKSERGFSSGCIRIEKAIELAVYLLSGNPRWSKENLLEALSTPYEQTVRLSNPITVHLLYWTAWSGEDGFAKFRKDIYGRDKPLYEALQEKPPS